jgi:hypothetical protein
MKFLICSLFALSLCLPVFGAVYEFGKGLKSKSGTSKVLRVRDKDFPADGRAAVVDYNLLLRLSGALYRAKRGKPISEKYGAGISRVFKFIAGERLDIRSWDPMKNIFHRVVESPFEQGRFFITRWTHEEIKTEAIRNPTLRKMITVLRTKDGNSTSYDELTHELLAKNIGVSTSHRNDLTAREFDARDLADLFYARTKASQVTGFYGDAGVSGPAIRHFGRAPGLSELPADLGAGPSSRRIYAELGIRFEKVGVPLVYKNRTARMFPVVGPCLPKGVCR